MPSPKELAKALARQDSVTQQPRNRFLGAIADAAGYVSDQADRYVVPERDPLFGGMRGGDLLPFRNVNRLLDDLSYGGRITTGRGQTTTLRPEVVDLAGVTGAMMPIGKAALRNVAEQVQNKTGIIGRNVIDPRMNIVSPEVANKINMPVTLPNSSDFISAVKGTKGAEITPDGLKMNLVRFQKPEQELEQSVRNGVFYLPEGNPNVKHYKNKGTLATGNPYGGNQKISGETLYKNPLFVKGATGGKAPEAAYKQLFGNDMFNKMTEEARSAASAPRHMKEEVAYKFLEDYAPELSDSAWNIVQNSNQGNQLRYALQEAVIGNSARQKGYDGILGYSKGRGDKGNFLSEVFDLRESHYPSPDGTSYLNDYFEELLGDGRAMSVPSNVGGAMMQRPKTEFEILHDTAQRNAALPKEQGGLGLPEGNTGMDRAAAMDWNTPAYHGTTTEIDPSFNLDYSGANALDYGKKNIWASDNPELASQYAEAGLSRNQAEAIQNSGDFNWNKKKEIPKKIADAMFKDIAEYGSIEGGGANVLPLLLRGKQSVHESYGGRFKNVMPKALWGRDLENADIAVINNVIDNPTLQKVDPSTVYAIKNPANIRSRFAAFDPMRRHEADILAGVGVGGMLDPQAIAEALRQQDRK